MAWDAPAFVLAHVDLGIDVVAVSDHDHTDHVADVISAATDSPLVVVPGIELSTDHGHLLVLAPGSSGSATIADFVTRVGIRHGQTQVAFDSIIAAFADGSPDAQHYRSQLVLIGAHVDASGSLLATSQPHGLGDQLRRAARLHALEVQDDGVRARWSADGVKQGPKMTLLRGSDRHELTDMRDLATWLYLPEMEPSAFHHALAVPESSVFVGSTPPAPPEFIIESVTFSGGIHDGFEFEFNERVNAIIGPPNSGKSLVVDAIKYVFDAHAEVEGVEEITSARMEACLVPGSSIDVRVRAHGSSHVLTRAVGSQRPPEVPFRPIIFSQSELMRRAMAAAPAIGLLDLHVANIDSLTGSVASAAASVRRIFSAVLLKANESASLRTVVENPVDGVDATRSELDALVGAEGIVRSAGAMTSVTDWRAELSRGVREWLARVGLEGPPVPPTPGFGDQSADFVRFVPLDEVARLVERAQAEAKGVAARLAGEVAELLGQQDGELVEMRTRIDEELAAAGITPGSDVEQRLGQLRRATSDLTRKQAELADIDREIDRDLADLKDALSAAETAREALSLARQAACTRVNESMHTFFAHVRTYIDASPMDELIDHLATGTWMRSDSKQELRNSLDRFALLEVAIRSVQGIEQADRSSTQDRLAVEAVRRNRADDLARLSCTWPHDALRLCKKTKPPTEFEHLTEGLRALAIKEISFASSTLPVVSDQPEDAVPTRSVFDSLVPTLRTQRAIRQFIVISHDANIVVASDVERVTVLQENDDGSPYTGGLADERVRRAALEHLEGGPDAFRARAGRYGLDR